MSRYCSEDEWELADLPRRMAYERSKFDLFVPCVVGGGPQCLTLAQIARGNFLNLLRRQTFLYARSRRNRIENRWVLRKLNPPRRTRIAVNVPVKPFTGMGMDEIIRDHRIVDAG